MAFTPATPLAARLRVVVCLAMIGMAWQHPASGAAPAGDRKNVREMEEDAIFDLPGIAQDLNGTMRAAASHPIFSVGKQPLTERSKRQAQCPDGESCVQDQINFTIRLKDRGILGNRVTRVTVEWTAMKGAASRQMRASSAGPRTPRGTWCEQAIGIRINNRLKAMDGVHAGQPPSAGRRLTVDIPPEAFSQDGLVNVTIIRDEHFAGWEANDWITIDAVGLEARS